MIQIGLDYKGFNNAIRILRTLSFVPKIEKWL